MLPYKAFVAFVIGLCVSTHALAAAPVFEEASTAVFGDDVTSVTLDYDTLSTINAGDLLIVIATTDLFSAGELDQYDDSTNKPTGYTLINHAGNNTSRTHPSAFYKIATGSETGTLTLPNAETADVRAVIVRISGADTSSPIHVVGSDYTTASIAALVIPGHTTTINDTLAFYVASGRTGTPTTVDAAWTEIGDYGAAGVSPGFAFGTQLMETAGATGDATVTTSISNSGAGFTFSIAPAGGGDTTPPTCTGSPAQDSIGTTSVTADRTCSDETDSTVDHYWGWTANDATDPTAEELRTNTYGGTFLDYDASDAGVTNGVESQVTLTGGTAGTAHDTFHTACDASDNCSTVAQLDVTTLTQPTFTAAIGTQGDWLRLTSSEATTAGAGGTGGVTISCSGGAVTGTYNAGNSTTTLKVYVLSRTVAAAETCTYDYTQPGDGWESSDDGVDIQSVSGGSVTNNMNRPLLTALSCTGTGTTTADCTVTTDEGAGTLYWIIDQSATAPSEAQIQAGQDQGGAAADDAGNETVSGTGAQPISATGLSGSTDYWLHAQHEDSDGGSQVYTSSSFQTTASGLSCSVDDSTPAPGATATFTCSGGDASNLSTVTSPGGDVWSLGSVSATSGTFSPALSDFVFGGTGQDTEWNVSGTWVVTNVGTQTANVTMEIDPPAGADQFFVTLTTLGGDASTYCPGAAVGDEAFADFVTGTNPAFTAACSAAADDDFEVDVTYWDESAAAGAGQWSATENTVVDSTAPTGYTISIDQASITGANETAASFTFAGAEVGATWDLSVTSSGGGGEVPDTGTIVTATDQITGIDVSSLPDGTLTFGVTLTDPVGNAGTETTDTVSKDTASAPSGYSVAIDQAAINAANDDQFSFQWAAAEIGATYGCTVTSSGGAGSVAINGTIASAIDEVGPEDVSSLPDGTLTLTCALTNGDGTGSNATDTVAKDATAPTGHSVSFDASVINAANDDAVAYTFAGAEVGAGFSCSITSSGGGTAVTEAGTVSTATDQITGEDVTALGDGTLTVSCVFTDTAGNPATAVTDTVGKDATAPTVTSIVVLTGGDSVRFTHSETVTGTLTGYSLTMSGGAVTLSNLAVNGSHVTADTSRTIAADETGTGGYTAGAVQDVAGNALATFSGTAVTVQSTAECDAMVAAVVQSVISAVAQTPMCRN